ncbi:MAG: DUF2182 domain-containing protein [Gammaproteobacteria bacterium]
MHWLVLFVAISVAWYFMYDMSVAAGNGHSGHHAHHGAADAPVLALFSMWALMAMAMMAPSLIPTLATYGDVIEAGAGKRSDFYALIAGYLFAWIIYAVAATWLQVSLARYALIDAEGRSLSHAFNAVLLFGAGAYQFSTLKAACLSKCRMPLTFFMERWREGTFGAISMGFRLGIICVACCWALMLVGFIGGIMSLLWMGAATVLMTFEKLPQLGRFVTRPIAFLFLAAGCWFTYLALT